MIHAVMLRFEGVVAHVAPSLADYIDEIAGSPIQLSSLVNDFYAAHAPWQSWFPDALEKARVDPMRFQEITARVETALSRPEAWQMYGDTRLALEWMAQRRIPVTIVSPYEPDTASLLSRSGIRAQPRFIGGIAALSDVVWRETSNLRVTASEILYVAGDLYTDFEDARAIGLFPLVMDRERQFDETVPNINQLVEVELHI